MQNMTGTSQRDGTYEPIESNAERMEKTGTLSAVLYWKMNLENWKGFVGESSDLSLPLAQPALTQSPENLPITLSKSLKTRREEQLEKDRNTMNLRVSRASHLMIARNQKYSVDFGNPQMQQL